MHRIYAAGLPLHPSEVTLSSRSQHLPVCTLGIEGDELTGVGIGRKEGPFGEVVDGHPHRYFIRFFVCG